ncbi:hypothetical protein AVEN_193931-1 [Araneus ventricosus]|uniref:Uncharacterized protein n=1 Tax=Araneus ventricosus TaxID=182803 RepID=A0A4Y2JVJ2_ARAVE|nr:hypothetical protein AVEN_193931-1 [Araneus ventricosus]
MTKTTPQGCSGAGMPFRHCFFKRKIRNEKKLKKRKKNCKNLLKTAKVLSPRLEISSTSCFATTPMRPLSPNSHAIPKRRCSTPKGRFNIHQAHAHSGSLVETGFEPVHIPYRREAETLLPGYHGRAWLGKMYTNKERKYQINALYEREEYY